ncbi:mechanosensitive ion channel family protein [Natronocalculus amylovorans]|uniref:Mechanosensitive ion channel n=1 Tax=Natronocalculus amylovorans TaxID=2917812 RepID=A0AAE3FX51_9EURY|nr:mechanosensitive ion channel domain-containing protein [Natronocalculus amylovorans]MCL9816982.1 mechanosensitive ion channel [Natronocalculus amylovorans]NUE02956.1 mechanosensitive ion channel [Halorubraceae archaeon YAN]
MRSTIGIHAQVDAQTLVEVIPPRAWLAIFVVAVGFILSYIVAVINRRILIRAGVPDTIEGTAFERTARNFGTSTVTIIAKLSGYFILLLSILVALTIAELEYADLFWSGVAVFLPQLFVAVVILLIGVVLADKAELIVAERLRGVKLPEIGLIPAVVKYSVLFVAVLIALGQVGVATLALIILLGAYAFALVVFTALATHDLLASGAAGVYLLLNQPYGIGDEVRVDGQRGIVQEVDLFVTRIETDEEEHIIPNRNVFKNGIVRIRNY